MVSINQYVSTVPGRLPKTKGKEPKKDQYTGGTIFVYHATGYIYLRHQVSLRVGEMNQAKRCFERFAAGHGVKVKAFHADNVPFGHPDFVNDLADDQTISFSGSGAHHQNAVAERAIQMVTWWARAMLLHACIHWSDNVDLHLWPFALEYAAWLWNNMPNRTSLLAPLELFSQSSFPSYSHLHQAHVWGCSVYVLDPKLQDGKKLPKWTPRSRRGQYLGPSPDHSTTIGRILNLRTGHISPQFHVVYDDLFMTVPNAEQGGVLELEQFCEESWRTVLETGLERTMQRDFDHDGHPLPLPSLSDEWLTPAEICLRDMSRRAARHCPACVCSVEHVPNVSDNDLMRQANPHDSINDCADSEPISAPEGEEQGESITGSQPPVQSIQFEDSQVDLDGDLDDLDGDDGFVGNINDDERSFSTLGPNVQPDDVPAMDEDESSVLSMEDGDSIGSSDSESSRPAPTRRG